VFITPVVETDGANKEVDSITTARRQEAKPPLMYWASTLRTTTIAMDGQLLNLTKNITVACWSGIHSAARSARGAVVSLRLDGDRPYNPQLDPIAIDEMWMLAETEVMEMTKRNVPGVWTYGFYDDGCLTTCLDCGDA